MTETDLKPAPKRPSKRRILLGVSLTLNLLLLGVFVGAHYAGKPSDPDERTFIRSLPVGPYGRALKDDDRKALRDAAVAARPKFIASRREMRVIGGEFVAVLRADPFEASALKAILAKQVATQNELLGLGQGLLIDRIKAMTDAERAAYADRLEKGLKRRPPRPKTKN